MRDIDDFIDIGHTKVAYRCTGDGPDLVFVHGWPLHGDTWRNVVSELPGFTCHLIDLPGAGSSLATASTPLTLQGHADSLGSVLDQLDLGRYAVVGHDSGGMFARLAAQKRTESVAALVLSGTEIPGHRSWQVALYALMAKLPGSGNVLKMLVSNDVLARSPLVLGGCFSDTDLINGEFGEIIADLFADEAVMDSQMTLIKNFDHAVVDSLAEAHTQLTMPSLLIWGADDAFFPVDKARDMASQFAGDTRFETVANAKLFVHEERPAKFASLTRDFLSGVDF
jgi:pimeloyl-ACP methyl ester carboxylesterase